MKKIVYEIYIFLTDNKLLIINNIKYMKNLINVLLKVSIKYDMKVNKRRNRCIIFRKEEKLADIIDTLVVRK